MRLTDRVIGDTVRLVDVRIRFCTVCWGYRSRALEVAEALRTRFGARVDVAAGKPGQFDVYVEGREVVSRSEEAILRMKPGGLPAVSEVIGIIENGFAPLGPDPQTRVFASEDAKRFYDRFGAMEDKQFYERAPLNELVSLADFEHASSIFDLSERLYAGRRERQEQAAGDVLDPRRRLCRRRQL